MVLFLAYIVVYYFCATCTCSHHHEPTFTLESRSLSFMSTTWFEDEYSIIRSIHKKSKSHTLHTYVQAFLSLPTRESYHADRCPKRVVVDGGQG